MRKTYRVGQVIKCIVKSVNPAMQKLKLSFNVRHYALFHYSSSATQHVELQLTPSMTPEEKAKLKEKLQNYTPGMVRILEPCLDIQLLTVSLTAGDKRRSKVYYT